jgi:hypothetical protein
MRTIIQELSHVCNISSQDATTYSTIFKDNKGCVDLIAAPTMRPRSRHISIKYHHFREHVRTGLIRIKWISTHDQLADIFTKPMPLSKFIGLQQTLLGWCEHSTLRGSVADTVIDCHSVTLCHKSLKQSLK